jgi:glycosyltransferase involved in cell wall biosynthesis
MGLGGAQTLVKGIFEHQKENKDIFLFVLRRKELVIDVEHINVRTSRRVSKYSWSQLFELKRIIETEKIDILHCHLLKSNFFGFLLKKIWFPDIILIVHEHGGIAFERIYKQFIKLAFRQIDLFLLVSNEMERHLLSILHKGNVKSKVLHNFVDTQKFQIFKGIDPLENKIKMGYSRHHFICGYAGRISSEKGWRLFLETASHFKDKLDIKFLIAGDGQEKEQLLYELGQKNHVSNVRYLGYVKDMTHFYTLLDCLIMPSYTESMGSVQLEAQASGVAVLASDIPGLREVVNNNIDCLLFEKGNAKEITEKLRFLHSDINHRNQLVENGYLNVKKYDVISYNESLNAVYQSIK